MTNTTAINLGKTQPMARIVVVNTEKMNMPYQPEYAPFALPKLVNHDSWRPATQPEDILAEIPEFLYVYATKRPNSTFQLEATGKDIVAQFGRALALEAMNLYEYEATDGRWHVLNHKYDNRKVRVCIYRGYAQVEESRLVNDRWSAWTAHPMSHKKGLYAEEVAPNQWYVLGSTFFIKDTLKALGGRWNPSNKGWKFIDGLPEEVIALLNKRYTKYHILTKMLQSGQRVGLKASGKDGLMDTAEAKYRVVDAYRREMWYTVGYDFKDYPQPINTPETMPMAQIELADDRIEQAVESGEGLVDAIIEAQYLSEEPPTLTDEDYELMYGELMSLPISEQFYGESINAISNDTPLQRTLGIL